MRQQAQDEKTSPEILSKLAINKERLIRQDVASNPNTPVEILAKLAMEFPQEIMANPILDLLMLDDLSQLLTLKTEVAKSPNTPESILDRLKDDCDDGVRLAVAENINAPERILNHFCNSSNLNTLLNIAKNISASESILDRLKNHSFRQVRVAVAQNPNTPEKILDCLKSNSRKVRIAVAENPNTSEKILDYLKSDRYFRVRIAVANNPNVSEKILDYLMNEKQVLVRVGIALNPNTSDDRLKKVANSFTEYSPDVMVNFVSKMRQAQNKNTPPEILAQLANKNESMPIRRAVARNPNTSEETLFSLKKDEQSVVIDVANNPNASNKLLDSFFSCPNRDAARKASWNLKMRQKIIQQAQSENTTSKTLARLASDKSMVVRQSVANNPNTPLETLETETLKKLVREFPQEIVAHPIFDILIIENPDVSLSLKISIFRHPNLAEKIKKLDLSTIGMILDLLILESPKRIETFKKKAANKCDASERVLNYLKNDRDREIRMAIANNPNTSEKILDRLKSDRDINVRLIVAGNSNTSINTLTELANSPDNNIASKAQCNLKVKTKAIQQAKNEDTSPKLLTQLASNKSKVVRQFVASNPNAPIGILRKLGQEFPEEVIANSIFNLLILEHFAKHPKSLFVHAVMLARSSKTPVKTFFRTLGDDAYAWDSDFS